MATDAELRIQALDAVVQWSYAVIQQTTRLEEIHAELTALWREGAPSHYGHEQRLPFIRLRIEKTSLLFAAANLIRAHVFLTELTDDTALPAPPGTLAQRAKVLRDCAEHWDEKHPERRRSDRSGYAFRQFADLFPDYDVEAHRWGAGGTVIAGLDVVELEAWAQDLHAKAIALGESTFTWRGWPVTEREPS